MSESVRELDTERAWYWDAASLIAALGGLFVGATNIPAAIEGIPFVQVIPALFLGGLAALAVDAVRVLVAPEPYEVSFIEVAGFILIVSVVSWAAGVRNRVRRVCQ